MMASFTIALSSGNADTDLARRVSFLTHPAEQTLKVKNTAFHIGDIGRPRRLGIHGHYH